MACELPVCRHHFVCYRFCNQCLILFSDIALECSHLGQNAQDYTVLCMFNLSSILQVSQKPIISLTLTVLMFVASSVLRQLKVDESLAMLDQWKMYDYWNEIEGITVQGELQENLPDGFVADPKPDAKLVAINNPRLNERLLKGARLEFNLQGESKTSHAEVGHEDILKRWVVYKDESDTLERFAWQVTSM